MFGGGGRATFDPSETLPGAIQAWADRDPGRPFLRDVTGGSRTYGEVHEHSLRWADAFRSAGVNPGDNVTAMVRTSIVALEHWLGLGWLRAVYTGVNTDFRSNSLSYVLANSRARHMICAFEFLDRLEEIASRVEHLEVVIVPDAATPQLPAGFPFRLVSAGDLWDSAQVADGLLVPQRHEISSITYTSGTTGASKGVLVPWGRLWPEVAWLDLGPDDIYYSPFPVFHLSGLCPSPGWAFRGARSSSGSRSRRRSSGMTSVASTARPPLSYRS